MESRVCLTPAKRLRQFGALLILLALIGPLALQVPAMAAQGTKTTEKNTTGELSELWRFEEIEGVLHTDPIYLDGVLYAISRANGTVHAIDAESGALLWEVKINVSSSFKVAVGDGLLITLEHDRETDESRLIALELDSEGKEERWSVEFDVEDGVPTAQPIFTPEGTVLVRLYRDARRDDPNLSREEREFQSSIILFDSKDGTELWRSSGMYYADAVVSDAGLIIQNQDEGGYTVVDIRTGKLLFGVNLNFSIQPVFERDGRLYVVTFEQVAAIDLESGVVLWATMVGGYNPEPLTYDDHALYVHAVFTDDDRDYDEILAFDLVTGGTSWTSVPISGRAEVGISQAGYLYVRSSNNVLEYGLVGTIVFDIKTGDVVAQIETMHEGLAVVNGVIYTGRETLVAYQGPGAEAGGNKKTSP